MAYLKWVGGKRSILSTIAPLLVPERDSAILYDVFCGAGTVGEAMAEQYRTVVMNDAVSDVIGSHRCVINHGRSFVNMAERFFGDGANREDMYYGVRDLFNASSHDMTRYAMFVYLNKHGYNGLCRFNHSGVYNVPFGRYASPPTCPSSEMMEFGLRLSGKAVLVNVDFEIVMRRAKRGDVVYCDPPYYPLSKTSNFTAYGQGGFTLADQARLADAARESPARVVVSNHDLPETRELYSGAEIIEVEAPGNISSKASARGSRREIIAIFNK